MELKIKDNEIDKAIKDAVIEKIVKPSVDEIMKFNMNPNYLQKVIEDTFMKHVEHKVKIACLNLLSGEKITNYLHNSIEDATNNLSSSLKSHAEEKFDKLFYPKMRDLDNLFDSLQRHIIKKEEDYDDKFFAKYLEGISKVGNIHFEIVNLKERPSENIEEFAKKFLKDRHRKGEIKSIHDGKGCPDLLVKNGDETYYVEVKSKMDGIRVDQIRWAENHPTKYIKFLFFDWNN